MARWAKRLAETEASEPSGGPGAFLNAGSRETGWEHDSRRTMGVARAIYLGLPRDARLWRLGREFVRVDPRLIRQALVRVG